jgi:streptogramin lyase
MKNKIFKLWLRGCAALGLALLASRLHAQTVTTIGGGAPAAPYAGYQDGPTLQAGFNQPSGLALDPAGNYLFVADYSNNVVRIITQPGTGASTTTTFSNSFSPSVTRGISRPISVVVDGATNVYVLNQGNGKNGTLLQFNAVSLGYPMFVATNASNLTNATAMAMDGLNNLYVTVGNNTVLRITPPNAASVVGVITNPGTYLQGIVVLDNGQLALSDAGTNSGIWLMNPYASNPSNNVTKLAGFNGTGDNPDNWPVPAAYAIFNHPANLAKAGNGVLVVNDNGNNRVKLLNITSGTVTLLYGVSSNYWGNPNTTTDKYPGWLDGASGILAGYVESRLPYGVVVAPDGSVFTAEDYYHVLRHVTSTGLTAPQPGYPSPFNSLQGIAFDSVGNQLFIANSANNTVQQLDLGNNVTTTFLTAGDGVLNPVSVLVDTNENIYVLNQGTPGDGSILGFDIYGNAYGPLVTGLNQPTAFTMDGYGNFFVTEQSGGILIVYPSGVSSLVATVTNVNVSLQGIALFDDGNIAVSDAGNHVIWTINPITKLITKLTGQLGVNGTAVGAANFAKLYQPHQLARVGGNQIVAADSGNNRLVLIQRNGTVSTNNFNALMGKIWFGQNGDPVANGSPQFVPMIAPFGIAAGNGGEIFVSETYYEDIRGLTGTGLTSPTSNPRVPLPFYSSPAGIALNNESTELFIADPTNNTISQLNLANNQTTVFLNSSAGIYQPVDVGLDSSDNLYILNQGTGGNGSILEFDKYGNLLGTNAASLTLPTAMKLDFSGNIYVSELNGMVQLFNSGGSNTLANITTNGNVQLQGIALLDNGSVVVSDAGNQVLWKIAPSATNAVLFTGVLGSPGMSFGGVGFAKLNQPMRLAQANGGLLLIVDSGNNRVVVANDLGTVSSALNSANATLWFGLPTDPVSAGSPDFVSMLSPVGIAIGTFGTVFASENIYKDIRGLLSTGMQAPIPPPASPLNLVATTTYGQVSLTWSASIGATNYNVKRSTSTNATFTVIGTTTTTSFTDTGVLGGSTYYYVVSAGNAGGESPNSALASAQPPLPPVPSPQIGYVDFPQQVLGGVVVYTSVFHPVSSFIFNNDAPLIILGAAGSQSYYTYGPTTSTIPDPTTNSASAPVGYQDGESPSQVAIYSINPLLPDVTIKAFGAKSDGSPNSAVVQARFQFVTANPSITGDNAAQFTISDATANAHLYYTIDGTDPSTNNGVDLGTVATQTNLWTVGFTITTNVLFKVVAVRDHYQPSAIVSTSFSPSNFVANVISFGFASGEASSDFVASPGQTFYAPVTLSVLPNTTIYSLQFNLTATNAGPNPGPAIAPGAFNFESFLKKPDLDLPGYYVQIPPYMFVETGSNAQPTSGSFLYDGNWFQNLVFTNTSDNLLGVGWLERYTRTNLYNTVSQDLITYSFAHDTMFLSSGGKVEVGGYAVQIPSTATNGQTYQIQIGRPSATSDGIGAPGSDVLIAAPTNGSTAGGAPINALEYITIGQRKYIAGSVYPFRWFNAGDFGSSNIVNADVEQVYQSAIDGPVRLNVPPPGTDLYDAMDSCGNIGVVDGDKTDPNFGYYTNSFGSLTPAQLNALFDGNDTTINQIAFGDGTLDVCDVYVTFRRSLDPSLTWFQRFWNNGQRVADTGAPNIASHIAIHACSTAQPKGQTSTTPPQVNFSAEDITGSAGQVVQIPITVTIFGSYPLRLLMLNLTVEPLDGSPALTVPIQFNQIAPLGTPYITGSEGNNNYSVVWLNSTNAGLTGSVTIGTLTVMIPSGATTNAAYAVHFDHASASPNGLASFPKQTLTGLITLSSRTNSSYGDGIPDSWRLRWFGTVNNLLSVSNACPSGDGIINWNKYAAGVDPNTANDFPSVNPRIPAPSGSVTAIHWPTIAGKQYVIERSSSLFSGNWTSIATNTGTGTDMEFDDNAAGTVKFYRVLILP